MGSYKDELFNILICNGVSEEDCSGVTELIIEKFQIGKSVKLLKWFEIKFLDDEYLEQEYHSVENSGVNEIYRVGERVIIVFEGNHKEYNIMADNVFRVEWEELNE